MSQQDSLSIEQVSAGAGQWAGWHETQPLEEEMVVRAEIQHIALVQITRPLLIVSFLYDFSRFQIRLKDPQTFAV